MRRFLTLAGLLGLSWLAAVPLRGQQPVDRPAASPAVGAQTWAELLARDGRVSFSQRTQLLAEQALADEKSSKERRAAAWLALGTVGAPAHRAELAEQAKSGTEPERSAAILGLGESGEGSEALLLELARSPEPELASSALLALLRTRAPALRRGVQEISSDTADSRSALATKLLVFAADPLHAEESAAVRNLLELRWRAAREFGLVDGQTWRVLVYRALGARPEFCSDVILRAAARLERPLVHDCLLGALLKGSGEGRLRAAARGIPRELAQLVQNGLWQPADLSEWSALFDELEQDRLEAYAPELFEAALAEPALRARALALYSRGGAQELAPEIEAALKGASSEDSVLLCRAMGESEDPSYLQRLNLLASASEPRVRAAALVAELLLGSRPGDAALRAVLANADDALRPALVLELAANARATSVLLLLEDEFARAEEPVRSTLALALAREGVREARSFCRDALMAEPPPAPEVALGLVRALRSRISSEDTPALRRSFPREDTPANLALNVELALALCEVSDASVQPLLHVTLWGSPAEISLLSGALIADSAGTPALRDEASNPPASARSTDLRRVGFALGALGGLPEVEALAHLLRYNSGAPALQGALLGFLSTRTQ